MIWDRFEMKAWIQVKTLDIFFFRIDKKRWSKTIWDAQVKDCMFLDAMSFDYAKAEPNFWHAHQY